jgi:hypothetical protein
VIDGEVCRRKVLKTASGRAVNVAVVKPAATIANITRMRETSEEWNAQAGQLRDGREQRRAYFAASVPFIVGSRLAHEYGLHQPRCCYLLAVDEDSGTVLGAATYQQKNGQWELSNLAVGPKNQHNPLNTDPVRGIATSILGVLTDDVRRTSCSTLKLQALDAKAEAFWHGRGFHNTTGPLHLTCPEVTALAEELSHSHPDLPDQGDAPFAVTPEEWDEVELAPVKGLVYQPDLS